MWNRLAYAPLAPFAVAASLGLVADRFLGGSSSGWLLGAIVGAMFWAAFVRKHPSAALVGLWACSAGLFAAYHHAWRHDFPANEIGEFATIEPRLARVRGTLTDEPSVRRRPANDPLVSRPRPESSTTLLSVSAIEVDGRWAEATGRARLTVEGRISELRVGDEVEVTGLLTRPGPPLNPGERNWSAALLDDRIRAELRVHGTSDAVVRLEPGSFGLDRTLASIRAWARRGIESSLAADDRPVATALLLGDNAAMTADEWDVYVRTGVIHVLAISGQHLVILGAFLWIVLRALGVRRRPAGVFVAITLLGYALLTGGRPSAMRAAVMAVAVCGAVFLRARALPANTFALAWLAVLAINPTDLFTAGFQLSFLCVAVLVWGIARWFPHRPRTPLEQLINESRSVPERLIRSGIYALFELYRITLVLGLATAPLTMYWQNVVSPGGLLIGPIAILLTTVALIGGFLLILLWPLGLVASPLAWVTGISLSACEYVVRHAERLPGGCWYTGSVPAWWMIGFYAIGLTWLMCGDVELAKRFTARWFRFCLAAWAGLGLLVATARPDADELRVTFLAVDHGGCAVIETPDGRVLLYDIGSTSGPEVTKRVIAPYLWSRGVRRIDEVFLSHADLDHFNGLPALLDRFAVGRVTYTPTFADKTSPAVRATLAALERRGTEVRTATAGDSFTAGAVEFRVLHPLPDGPAGVENVRSLVLLVRHRGHSILLTGDLEGMGMEQVISRPAPSIDVLMTPHHGSAKIEPLADWAKPRLVVSSQGRADAGKAQVAYRNRGIPYLATWPDGAITLRSHATGLTVETFASGKREVVRGGGQ